MSNVFVFSSLYYRIIPDQAFFPHSYSLSHVAKRSSSSTHLAAGRLNTPISPLHVWPCNNAGTSMESTAGSINSSSSRANGRGNKVSDRKGHESEEENRI